MAPIMRRICQRCNFAAFDYREEEREFLLPSSGKKRKWSPHCAKCRAVARIDRARAEVQKIQRGREIRHAQRRERIDRSNAVSGGSE